MKTWGIRGIRGIRGIKLSIKKKVGK